MPAFAKDAIEVDAIRDHYDRLSSLYFRFWGEHIHHGFWEGAETVSDAQVNLIARLADAARVPRGARVLDVGCGLGGSALWLAEERNCFVHGLTLSPVQATTATKRAQALGLQCQVCFHVGDANRLELEPESYDVVWTIECSEHLFDKPRFIASAASALTPDGSLAICAWLADPQSVEHQTWVDDVCRGMLCPSLGSQTDYINWIRSAGLQIMVAEDITRKVERTWDRARSLLERPEVQAILKVSGRATREFAHSFLSIQQAYAAGAMSYGLFVARKPAGSEPARRGEHKQSAVLRS
jgi:tocopherol O-methyltransferase